MNAQARSNLKAAMELLGGDVEVLIALFRLGTTAILLPILSVLYVLGFATHRIPLYTAMHLAFAAGMYLLIRARPAWRHTVGFAGLIGDVVLVAGFFWLRTLEPDLASAQRAGAVYATAPMMIAALLVHGLRNSAWHGVIGSVVGTAGFAVVATRLDGVHMPQLFAGALILIAGALTTAFAHRARRDLETLGRLQLLRRYLPAPAVDRVLRDNPKEALAPGGSQAAVTVVAVDFREVEPTRRNDPAVFFERLNRRHAAVIELADAHGGIVDKFIGEGALVVFGLSAGAAHDTGANAHGDCGAQAAVLFARALAQRLDEARRAEGGSWDLCIGLHTGTVVAGNLGAESARLEFTVIGDTVNTAARLKELARGLRQVGIVSGDTVSRLGGAEGLTRLDDMPLRGRKSAVACFALNA